MVFGAASRILQHFSRSANPMLVRWLSRGDVGAMRSPAPRRALGDEAPALGRPRNWTGGLAPITAREDLASGRQLPETRAHWQRSNGGLRGLSPTARSPGREG